MTIGTTTVPDDVLTRFLAPNHPVLKDILALWNYRGDGSQSNADRLRKVMGDEAYEHFNWDTAVSNGRVLLVLRHYKHPKAVKPPFGFSFPSEWFWCFSQIADNEEIESASSQLIETVPPTILQSLAVLPELQWVRVRQVNFVEHGRGRPKAKTRSAPEGVAFFRFQGGLGLSIAVRP